MSDDPAVTALALLRGCSATLATAESLTGGLIGALLTAVPGASHAYLGGAITYATRLKATLAEVDEETLAAHGPVDPRTAAQMARGIARRCSADWGLAVTGVAGPDPQDGHPVGQVFVAVARARDGETAVRELRLTGDRAAIRSATARLALELLAERVGEEPDAGGAGGHAADRAGPRGMDGDATDVDLP